MKKLATGLLLVIFIYLILTIVGPPMADRKLNGTVNLPPYAVSSEAQEIYNNLEFIADLHCDALLWRRPMHKKLKRSHVDLVKMQEANVAMQVFTVVSKSPKGLNFDSNDDKSDNLILLSITQKRPVNSWFNLRNRVGAQSKALHKLEKKSKDKFQVIKSQTDLKELIAARKKDKSKCGGLFGLEGAHPLMGELGNIDYIYEKGARMVGLVHFFDNEVGGSAHGINKGGLTEFGKMCINEFEERGITVDLAHSSELLISEVLKEVTKPVVVSHTGVKGICDRGRNLSDEQIKGVANTGGIIGIAFFEETMCDMDPASIAAGIKYVRDLVGIEHVALGSDYDGSVEVPFDITGLPIIVEELLKMDFTESEIKKVMGENVRDLLLTNLPV